MRTTRVIGHASGHTYEAHDTGDSWNGADVLAFTAGTLSLLIAAGDGADANGEGLAIRAGEPVDVTDGEVRPLPTRLAEVDGDTRVLYVPEGCIWPEADPNSGIDGMSGIEWDDQDQCSTCGAHIAGPHSPECPAATAAALHRTARDHEAAEADKLTGAASPPTS